MENKINMPMQGILTPQGFKPLPGQEVVAAKDPVFKDEELVLAVGFMHPQLILIQRHVTKDKTKGGIIKPHEYFEREKKSTSWGKILKISVFASDDVDMLRKRAALKVGHYVQFKNINAINMGFPSNPNLQGIAVDDVMLDLSDQLFTKYVKDEDL